MRFISDCKELFLSISNDYVVKMGKHFVVPKRNKTYISYKYKISEEDADRFSFRIKGTNRLLTDMDMIKAFNKIDSIEVPIEFNDIELLLKDERLKRTD